MKLRFKQTPRKVGNSYVVTIPYQYIENGLIEKTEELSFIIEKTEEEE